MLDSILVGARSYQALLGIDFIVKSDCFVERHEYIHEDNFLCSSQCFVDTFRFGCGKMASSLLLDCAIGGPVWCPGVSAKVWGIYISATGACQYLRRKVLQMFLPKYYYMGMVFTWDEIVKIEGGISNAYLSVAKRKYKRVSHGIYVDDGEFISELEQLFARYPRATLTLQSAFEHYDDNLEHSIWLNLMISRLQILRVLLSADGSIWINLDDNEVHYCKVIMDELFGRSNFLCDLTWEKRYSPPPDTKEFGYVHDLILVYRKSSLFRRNLLPLTEDQTGRYKNPDNDPRGPWKAADYTCRFSAEQRPNLYYPIVQPNTGKEIWPKKTRVWANSIEEHEKNVREDRLWWGINGRNSVPAKKNFLSEIQQGMMPMSLWHYQMAGTNQDA